MDKTIGQITYWIEEFCKSEGVVGRTLVDTLIMDNGPRFTIKLSLNGKELEGYINPDRYEKGTRQLVALLKQRQKGIRNGET